MTCKEFYDIILVNALGLLKGDKKKAADEHLKTCQSCRNMTEALKNLFPKMQFGGDTEFTYFGIYFPTERLWLTGNRYYFDEYEKIRCYMDEHDGALPRDCLSVGCDDFFEIFSWYDEKGNVIDCDISRSNHHIRRTPKTLPYFAPNLWLYETLLMDWSGFDYKESKEAKGLFRGTMSNCLGVEAKSMLFHAIPKEAENVRIKRGNSVLDCESYYFAYVERYVAEDEKMTLEYSFQLKR